MAETQQATDTQRVDYVESREYEIERATDATGRGSWVCEIDGDDYAIVVEGKTWREVVDALRKAEYGS